MRILGLVRRILTERIRDKRTLALLFIAPLLILTLMHVVFDEKTVNPKIGTVNVEPSIIKTLEDQDMDITKLSSTPDNIEKSMTKAHLDGIVIKDGERVKLHLLNEDPALSSRIKLIVSQVYQKKAQSTMVEDMKAKVSELSKTISKLPFSPTKEIKFEAPKKTKINTSYVYGDKDTSLFDTFSPILIGFFVFLFVFLISGIGFLQERTSGTLERMLMTPIRRYEVVIAYIIGFGLLAIFQTIVVVLFAVYVLKIAAPSVIGNVIVINLVVALVALSLGLLLSAFARSEFQMIQFIPIVIVPQVFLSGIFSLENMAGWLQGLSRFMPLYYAGDALKGVMYRGESLVNVWFDILVLFIFALIFAVLNVIALKKYRSI